MPFILLKKQLKLILKNNTNISAQAKIVKRKIN